jgi:uncharacterized protein (TIGR00251 family)
MAHRETRAARTTVRVRVTPRARADEIVGARDGAILVRVTAPPHEGRANDAVRRVLAKRLRVAASRVQVIRGERSRDKLVRVDGMSAAEVQRALQP